MIRWWLVLIVGIGILVAGCAGPLKQFTSQASELSRVDDFTRQELLSNKIGILTATGLENYRLVIANSLRKAFEELEPEIMIISPNEAISLINQADLSEDYTKMLVDHRVAGILQKSILRKVSQALGVQYLVLPNLLEYQRESSTRISALGFRFLKTRSSTLRVMVQIWNGRSGDLVWESSAEVTLAGENIREKPISFEEVSLRAWRELIKTLP